LIKTYLNPARGLCALACGRLPGGFVNPGRQQHAHDQRRMPAVRGIHPAAQRAARRIGLLRFAIAATPG